MPLRIRKPWGRLGRTESAPHPFAREIREIQKLDGPALGLLALSIFIFFWAIGYRVSLYAGHPDSVTRSSITRLWVETRQDRAEPTSLQAAHGKAAPVEAAVSLAHPNRDIAQSEACTADPAQQDPRHIAFRLLPQRSPPPFPISLT